MPSFSFVFKMASPHYSTSSVELCEDQAGLELMAVLLLLPPQVGTVSPYHYTRPRNTVFEARMIGLES